jgi:hypothetical protein
MLDNGDYAALMRDEVVLEACRKARELAGRGLTHEEVWAGIGHEFRLAERELLTLVVRQELESARWTRLADSSYGEPLGP